MVDSFAGSPGKRSLFSDSWELCYLIKSQLLYQLSYAPAGSGRM